MAKKKGILTVGVVTLPFHNEGQDSLAKAVDGINELEKNVDSLLIINNEKLYAYYGDLLIQDAFPKADEVLATAVRKRGHINVDFNDVKAMMKNSGMALMGCGTGTGENRLEDAVKNALESPLLNDFDPTTAKNVLINITVGRNERGVKMTQLEQINALIKEYTGDANNFKSGIVFDDDPDFGDRVNITVIATGFKGSVLDSMVNVKLGNIIWVDQDFVYERGQTDSEEIELPEVRSHRIGYNNTVVRKKNIFADGEKPVLLVEEAQSLSDLENVPAIRRRANPHSRTEE